MNNKGINSSIKRTKTGIIFSLIVMILAIFLTANYYIKLSESRNEQKNLKTKAFNENVKILQTLNELSCDTVSRIDKENVFNDSNLRLGNLSTEERRKTLELIRSTVGTRSQVNIEIWGDKEKGSNIESILKLVNYNVTLKKSKNDTPINSLWYSSNSSLENVKLISILMINSGLNIKQIKKRQNSFSITQIGSEPSLISDTLPNLTFNEIIKFTR